MFWFRLYQNIELTSRAVGVFWFFCFLFLQFSLDRHTPRAFTMQGSRGRNRSARHSLPLLQTLRSFTQAPWAPGVCWQAHSFSRRETRCCLSPRAEGRPLPLCAHFRFPHHRSPDPTDEVNSYIRTHKMEALQWPGPCHKPKPKSACT